MGATRRRIVLAAVLACTLASPPSGVSGGALRVPLALAAGLPVLAQAKVSSAAAIATTSASGQATASPSAIGPPVSIGARIGPGTVRGLLPPEAPLTSEIPSGLDEATKRALQLQDRIELAQQDATALQQRIAVVNARIFGQQNVLDEALIELDLARGLFEDRLVEMYKSGLSNPLVLLLSARSLSDFYSRALLVSRIIADDVASFRAAEIASQEAEYAASVLDEMKSQLVFMRALLDSRLADAKRDLAEERALIATLSAKNRELVVARRAATELTRKQWRESSIPIGAAMAFKTALLEPAGEAYLVSDYQPPRYSATGEPFTAVCSWYGNEFNGRPTASGQIFNQDDLTCASRTLPFGTRIALSRGAKRVIVVVTDRGPFVPGRDLDLSRAAARALGFSGVEPVAARYVLPSSEATGSAQ